MAIVFKIKKKFGTRKRGADPFSIEKTMQPMKNSHTGAIAKRAHFFLPDMKTSPERRPISSFSTTKTICNFRNSYWSILKILLLLSYQANSQIAGICGCSPSVLTFKLDFNRTCPPDHITIGPSAGIDNAFCEVSPQIGIETDNIIPVQINSVSILELGQDLSVIAQSSVSGSLLDGDSFTYSSIIERHDGELKNIPGGLQVQLTGVNSEMETIINGYILTYTNRCDIFPFAEGDSLGWTIFTNLGAPPTELCPLVSKEPSAPPIIIPSVAPTLGLSLEPSFSTKVTHMPSTVPSKKLPPITEQPTKYPAPGPTITLTAVPSPLPSTFPSNSPIRLPSNYPTLTIETLPPTNYPSVTLETSPPTDHPTVIPEVASLSPTDVPTDYDESAVPTYPPTVTPDTLSPTDRPTVTLETLSPTENPVLSFSYMYDEPRSKWYKSRQRRSRRYSNTSQSYKLSWRQ